MLLSARRGISYPNPDRSDRPDIPAHILNLINALEVDVVYAQGTDAARIARAHMAGTLFWTTDTLLVWYDDGAVWRQVGISETTVIADASRYGTHAARPAANTVAAGTIYWESDTGGAFRSDGANWIGPINPGAQIDYAAVTAAVTVTQASNNTESTAVALATGNSVAYDGSKVKVKYFAPNYDWVGAGGSGILAWGFNVVLLRDSTVLGHFSYVNSIGGVANEGNSQVVDAEVIDTPAAGNHIYKATAWWTNGNSATAKIYGGLGGAGNFVPAYLMVSKA